MTRKYSIGTFVRVEGDNTVWDGSIGEIVEFTNDPRFPYLVHFKSSPRPHTEGQKYEWPENTLVRHEDKRYALHRFIEETFPKRLDVFYSETTGGAVVMERSGRLVRLLEDGTIDDFGTRG